MLDRVYINDKAIVRHICAYIPFMFACIFAVILPFSPLGYLCSFMFLIKI